MLSDLLSVEDALTPIIHSYNGLARLISEGDISHVDSTDLGALLASVNQQLQTVRERISEGRKANIAQ